MTRPLRRTSWVRRLAVGGLAACAAGFLFDNLVYCLAKAGVGSARVRAFPLRSTAEEAFCLHAEPKCPEGTIVILASLLVRARSYLPLLRELTRRFRVLVLELPGSGRGSRLEQPWTTEQYARWTASLLAENGLHAITLVGHSNSGPVALHTALQSPHVARLVLVDSIGARRRGGIVTVIAARCVDGLQELALDLRGWWHLAYNVVVHPRSFLAQVRAASRCKLLDAAHFVRVPAVIAWAPRDVTMPIACARRFQASMPHARLVVGPGAHDWLITHPRAFVERVFPSDR